MTTSDGPRTRTEAGRLARRGFLDAVAAADVLAQPELACIAARDDVLEALSASADPDQALALLGRLLAAQADPTELAAALGSDSTLRQRLTAVLGVSLALGEHLIRHADDWRRVGRTGDEPVGTDVLRDELLRTVGADPAAASPTASAPASADALRVGYRRLLLDIAVRDLDGADLGAVAAELADLASATLDAALAVARAEVAVAGADPGECRLAVIGMGKCGGRELNYISDVDVIFVAEPAEGADETRALRTATRIAAALVRTCSVSTAEGALWEVDAALRPEGKAGPLVRTVASHRAYYERWASTWEFQALLKARAVAGDVVLGRTYLDAVRPMVWRAAERDNFVEDVQAMRRRVEAHVGGRRERELKLGPGGLRDVEFSVQLLQLVHGRADETLRSGSTLEALQALSAGGYVGRDDAATLDAAYRFLRTLEHRIQLHRLRRTHVLPDDPVDLRRLGRQLGHRSDPVAALEKEWRRHAREARRLHEKLFYRPLLNAVARLGAEETRLRPEAARDRLVALGYADPAGALRHLEALTAGMSRTAAIQRTLLPVLLGWFADAPDPDAGLLGFRQVSDALGTTPWYLRMLRDEGAAAERMAHVLASSRYATDLLLRAPDAVGLLARDEDLRPPSRSALLSESLAAVRRQDEPTESARAARGIRRRELFRIAAADVLGLLPPVDVAQALTDVAVSTLVAGLDTAVRSVEGERRAPLPTRLSVVAMGRLGGQESGYASDADVLFVHDPVVGADEREAHDAAHAVANELRRLLAQPAPDPPLLVDAGLRPEGRQGPLVRSLASYAAYYARWSAGWESQALLRACPVAGDEELGERFCALIDPLRYPAAGIGDAAVRELRRIKARVEAERLPRGADPSTHAKLGRGALADVEWTVQLLQLRHGAEVAGLRTTRTLAALDAAVDAGLVDGDDAAALSAAWQLASRLRDAVLLVSGRPGDDLPRDLRVMAGVSRLVAPHAATGAFVDEYRRTLRRSRAVVERVFYG